MLHKYITQTSYIKSILAPNLHHIQAPLFRRFDVCHQTIPSISLT